MCHLIVILPLMCIPSYVRTYSVITLLYNPYSIPLNVSSYSVITLLCVSYRILINVTLYSSLAHHNIKIPPCQPPGPPIVTLVELAQNH